MVAGSPGHRPFTDDEIDRPCRVTASSGCRPARGARKPSTGTGAERSASSIGAVLVGAAETGRRCVPGRWAWVGGAAHAAVRPGGSSGAPMYVPPASAKQPAGCPRRRRGRLDRQRPLFGTPVKLMAVLGTPIRRRTACAARVGCERDHWIRDMFGKVPPGGERACSWTFSGVHRPSAAAGRTRACLGAPWSGQSARRHGHQVQSTAGHGHHRGHEGLEAGVLGLLVGE